ncbi:hypothetical protein B0H14DRAFT_3512639 [Mycena olivaceomarginata]|nr:hypothetical protein B0H14DRAFT_3512639 [Mycena olivaceomarginata]
MLTAAAGPLPSDAPALPLRDASMFPSTVADASTPADEFTDAPPLSKAAALTLSSDAAAPVAKAVPGATTLHRCVPGERLPPERPHFGEEVGHFPPPLLPQIDRVLVLQELELLALEFSGIPWFLFGAPSPFFALDLAFPLADTLDVFVCWNLFAPSRTIRPSQQPDAKDAASVDEDAGPLDTDDEHPPRTYSPGDWEATSGFPGGGWVTPPSDDEDHGPASDWVTASDDATSRDGVGINPAEAWRSWGAGTPWSWRDLPRGMLKGAPVSPLPERRASPKRLLVVPEPISDLALNLWIQQGFLIDCEPILEAWETLAPSSRGANVGTGRNAMQELRCHALEAFRVLSLATVVASPQDTQVDLAHQILAPDSTQAELAHEDVA